MAAQESFALTFEEMDRQRVHLFLYTEIVQKKQKFFCASVKRQNFTQRIAVIIVLCYNEQRRRMNCAQELFQSDFKVVADYFVQKRENGDYVPSSQDLTHVQETLQLLSIMTNDHRFEDAYNTSTDDRKGGPRNMCDVLDKVENRGIEKGIVKGESRGENKMALLVKKLLDQNRIDDVKRASEDEKSRAELMKELGIN